MLRPVNESLLEPIIDAVELLPEIRWRLLKEAAQALRIGITGQAGQVLERAVGSQERSGLDAIQAQHNRIDEGQSYLGKSIALVASGIVQMPCEEISQLQHSIKFMEKVNSAVVSQTRVITGDC